MKKITLILCSVFFITTAQAQFNYFAAEGNNYYEVKSVVPNSDVEFYSEKWGGKQLKKFTVDEQGYLLLKSKSDFKPAFALNRSTVANAKGIKGNGKVQFINECEFSFNDVKLENTGLLNTITWHAAVNKDQEISFEIFKSKDNVNYEPVTKINAQSIGNILSYSVTDKNSSEYFYKIKVVNSKTGLRYTSKLIAAENEGKLKIYPVPAGKTINVFIGKGDLDADYRILNEQGQLVGKGKLNTIMNVIPIERLASGN